MDVYWDGDDKWYTAEVRRRKRQPSKAPLARFASGAFASGTFAAGALVHELYYPADRELHWHDLAQHNPDGNRWRPRGWRPVEQGNAWAAGGGGVAGGGAAGGGAARGAGSSGWYQDLKGVWHDGKEGVAAEAKPEGDKVAARHACSFCGRSLPGEHCRCRCRQQARPKGSMDTAAPASGSGGAAAVEEPAAAPGPGPAARGKKREAGGGPAGSKAEETGEEVEETETEVNAFNSTTLLVVALTRAMELAAPLFKAPVTAGGQLEASWRPVGDQLEARPPPT